MSQKEEVRIRLKSVRYEVEASLFAEEEDGLRVLADDSRNEPETIEIRSLGTLLTEGGRTEISYEETEMSGMAGTTTRLIFDTRLLDTMTLMRSGPVKVTMVFEKGLRHVCRYDTGIIPFELVLTTSYIDNRLLTDGELYIDYTTELAGSSRAITHMKMRVWDAEE